MLRHPFPLTAHRRAELPAARKGVRAAADAWLRALLLAMLGLSLSCEENRAGIGSSGKGRLDRINGYLVLHVEGAPEEMGEQHGRLLKAEIRRVLADVIDADAEESPSLLRGAMTMEKFLPEDYRRELRALAAGAEVDYERLVALQLFGDVRRSQYCTFYAVFGEATRTGEPIIGRNMDYWDYGVSDYGCVLIHFKPATGHPFLTVSWAGIINGWTAMNDRGVVAANNTGYGTIANSLEGLSTCFMLRKIVQYASTCEQGIETIRTTPRSCGTIMLVASAQPPDAAAVEYDHKEMAVRRAQHGVVLADNDFMQFYLKEPRQPDPKGGARCDVLWNLIQQNFGRIDREMNFAAAEGVAIRSMNLHSALLFPRDLSIHLSMGKTPACDQPYRKFRMTSEGIVSGE